MDRFLPHDWLALATGLIVAAYWWRVLRMVRKSRKTAGHGANFVPPEPLGWALRTLWIPVVAMWVYHPFHTAFALKWPAVMLPLFHSVWASAAGTLVALAAFLATRVCWKRMGKSWRMGIDPNESTALIVTGPYSYVRHPIYALSSLMMLATIVVIASPVMTAAGAIHLIFLQWEARREEAHLTRVHGEMFKAYCSRVGRFFPLSTRAYAGPQS